jgi:hypothetical protein
MDIASKIPVVEGGPAGSGVLEATISAAPERLGGAALGNILKKRFLKISRTTASMNRPRAVVQVAPKSPLPADPEPSHREGPPGIGTPPSGLNSPRLSSILPMEGGP